MEITLTRYIFIIYFLGAFIGRKYLMDSMTRKLAIVEPSSTFDVDENTLRMSFNEPNRICGALELNRIRTRMHEYAFSHGYR